MEDGTKEGRFIVFEGGERTGKSTQIKILAERLTKAGIDIVLTKEPGGSSRGAEIREKLLYGKCTSAQELSLFLEDRALHFKELIAPALKEGKWVLCDRNAPSTVAYQGYGRGMDVKEIKRLNSKVMRGRNFDLVVLLDMDPEKALSRAEKETRFDKEKLEFHKRVRRGFLEQWMEDKRSGKRPVWFFVGASQSPEEVAYIIWKEVGRRFLTEGG